MKVYYYNGHKSGKHYYNTIFDLNSNYEYRIDVLRNIIFYIKIHNFERDPRVRDSDYMFEIENLDNSMKKELIIQFLSSTLQAMQR